MSTNNPPTRPPPIDPVHTHPNRASELALEWALPGTPAKRVYGPNGLPFSPPPANPGSGK